MSIKKTVIKINNLPDHSLTNFVKKGITFFKDVEDFEKARIESVISTDPVTRLKNTVDLIKRVYGYDTMDKSNISKKLYFK